MDKTKYITVGELRSVVLGELNAAKDSDLVFFGGGDLSLYRLKNRGPVEGPAMYQFEFNELYTVTYDPMSEPQEEA